MACIRKHLSVVTGVTIDVRAFKKLPSHFFQTYGNDPVFVVSARALLKVLEFKRDRDKISSNGTSRSTKGMLNSRVFLSESAA